MSTLLTCYLVLSNLYRWQFPKIGIDDKTGMANCSDVIMSDGRGHILKKSKCALCCLNGGLKVKCDEPKCRAWGQLRTPVYLHPTCARQAGLEIDTMPDNKSYYHFYGRCFRHSSNGYAFRAKLEDLLEIEKRRAGKRLTSTDSVSMSYAHASRLLNAAFSVMESLGWVWRWAEWWVSYGDNWEPFLEPHEKEENMTKAQLRIVDSTKESRCADARKCRLAALGAALRNRKYDDEKGDNRVALDRALRAMLHTQSLVGPLEGFEVDFFAEWLGRAYRTKSRLLGFGEDKISVASDGHCVHIEDKSPKYELGSRPLPGKHELAKGEIFESDVREIDDFLKPEILDNGIVVTDKMSDGWVDVIKKKKEKEETKTQKRSNSIDFDDYVEGNEGIPTHKSNRKRPKVAEPASKIQQKSPKKKGWPKGKPRSSKKKLGLPLKSTSPEKKIYTGKRRGRPPKSKSIEISSASNDTDQKNALLTESLKREEQRIRSQATVVDNDHFRSRKPPTRFSSERFASSNDTYPSDSSPGSLKRKKPRGRSQAAAADNDHSIMELPVPRKKGKVGCKFESS